ncbi:MAG: prepilin-type N-terminal cleavage/methylation domain-containing protein [Gammaproteobacteria bacterium]|nr:prepilin-type N-terminal cleavage/methylation domain-containing protein [Gammaproteobacteria bacterium]MCP5202521.1 prepilin-type N-terminal cleavage/methylation domain-containing protein [Gammaproteobacteria bacterium]
MEHSRNTGMEKGFTLVELLIVVIILAILAAIVVPQFSATTDDAKLSSLDANLANMRGAVDLYYQQHGAYPGAATSIGTACAAGPSGATGTGAAASAQAFLDQLSKYTNAAGESCTKSDANFKYGPYLKKAALPANPMTAVATLSMSTAGALGMTSASTNGGWKFDTKTGQFIADHTDYDDR